MALNFIYVTRNLLSVELSMTDSINAMFQTNILTSILFYVYTYIFSCFHRWNMITEYFEIFSVCCCFGSRAHVEYPEILFVHTKYYMSTTYCVQVYNSIVTSLFVSVDARRTVGSRMAASRLCEHVNSHTASLITCIECKQILLIPPIFKRLHLQLHIRLITTVQH